MGIKSALPKYEIYFYNTVLCLAVFWAAGWIFEVSSCEYEEAHTRTQTHRHTHRIRSAHTPKAAKNKKHHLLCNLFDLSCSRPPGGDGDALASLLLELSSTFTYSPFTTLLDFVGMFGPLSAQILSGPQGGQSCPITA